MGGGSGVGLLTRRDGDTQNGSLSRRAPDPSFCLQPDDLRHIVPTLTGKVRVEFVKENLTFTSEDSPLATLLLSVMGVFAEFELALILERQREGIAVAKQRGVYTGHKPALTPRRPTSCASVPPPVSGLALVRRIGCSNQL